VTAADWVAGGIIGAGQGLTLIAYLQMTVLRRRMRRELSEGER
jgi:hypothetical protein